MSQRTRTVLRAVPRGRLAIAAALAAAALVAGCGGENLDPGAVARVGEEKIEKSEFDRWMETAAAGQQAAIAPGSAQEVTVPEPPDFSDCVAVREEQASALEDPPGGQGRGPADQPEPPTEDELREQCEQEYELLKEQVMQFLIQAEAIELEAEERGVSVSDEEVSSQLEDLKQQSFPNDEQYQQFLETSGMTEEDLLFRIRLDLLIAEIRDDVLAEAGEPTEEEITAYYEENKDQPPIGQPEQREVRVVVTETEQQAERAREAIEDGEAFASVAREFSIDRASRNRGGKLTLQEGAEEEQLDEAVFSADVGELTGPVETGLGFYVFEVTDVRKGSTESLEDSREAIVEILRAEEEQQLLTDFQEEFEEKAREETVCAEEFVIVGCSNGPDPEEAPDPGLPVPPPEGAPGAPPAPDGPPPAQQPGGGAPSGPEG